MADEPEVTEAPTSFTQDDVTAAATRAAKEAERKARQKSQQDIADQLGVSVEEAKAIIAAKHQADEAQRTELDRAREAQTEAERRATEAENRAATIAAQATATQALVAAGLNASYLNDGLRLIDVTVDDDAETAAEKAKALAERLPALFTPTATGSTPPPPGVNPPARQTGGNGGKSATERAKERFAAQHTFRPPAA